MLVSSRYGTEIPTVSRCGGVALGKGELLVAGIYESPENRTNLILTETCGGATTARITLYDVDTRKITYLTQTVDRDTNPAWSADGKSVSFVRRPGLAFSHFATTPIRPMLRPMYERATHRRSG